LARFVLVHGAFGGAWCWEPVVAELRAKGHEVEAIDLPGAGDDPKPAAEATLDDYTERICEVLGHQPEPVVLVAHSAGGISVTQAAARSPDQIAALVYVAAFLPRDGQSLIDIAQLPEGAGDQVQANMVVDGDPPVGTMPATAAPGTFYGSCTEEQAAWATARLGPQPMEPFVTPVNLGERGTAGLRRSYVICTQDRALPTPLQRRLVQDNPCDEVVEIDTDHSPFLSATSELVAALERFAASYG